MKNSHCKCSGRWR